MSFVLQGDQGPPGELGVMVGYILSLTHTYTKIIHASYILFSFDLKGPVGPLGQKGEFGIPGRPVRFFYFFYQHSPSQ